MKELKIMTANEMVRWYEENYNAYECDFASIDIDDDMEDIKEVYKEAHGWCGIRKLKNKFDGDDVIVSIGDFGYGLIDVFSVRDDDEFPVGRLCDAVAQCEYIDAKDFDDNGYARELDDVLLIVEIFNKKSA